MRLAFLLLAAAALATCGRPDVVAEEETNAAALPEPVSRAGPTPTGGAPRNAVRTQSGSPFRPLTIIPSALHGRWGLTPADCDSPLGDAKGLLVINAEELRFYESRAVPTSNVEATVNSISGEFAFTGEGQQWTKRERLEVRDGRLIRTERDPGASFRYVSCD